MSEARKCDYCKKFEHDFCEGCICSFEECVERRAEKAEAEEAQRVAEVLREREEAERTAEEAAESEENEEAGGEDISEEEAENRKAEEGAEE